LGFGLAPENAIGANAEGGMRKFKRHVKEFFAFNSQGPAS
jgi:hypothetical protein